MFESLSGNNLLTIFKCARIAPFDDMLIGLDMRVRWMVKLVLELIRDIGKKIGAKLLRPKLYELLASQPCQL